MSIARAEGLREGEPWFAAYTQEQHCDRGVETRQTGEEGIGDLAGKGLLDGVLGAGDVSPDDLDGEGGARVGRFGAGGSGAFLP